MVSPGITLIDDGDMKANWRIVFRFADSDAHEVELMDYL